jgi:hypothetical protein
MSLTSPFAHCWLVCGCCPLSIDVSHGLFRGDRDAASAIAGV